MQHLVDDLGIRYVLLRDPMFSFNQKRVLVICDETVRRGLQLEWECGLGSISSRSRRSGPWPPPAAGGQLRGRECRRGNPEGVGRAPTEQARFRETITLCRELGIDTFAFLIIGLPGDTVTSILKTIKFAIDVQPTCVQFTAASPFIGTKLRDWALERGLTSPDKYAYISSHAVQIGNGTLSQRDVQRC